MSETAVNGYLKSQVANIEYDKTNIENPTYYVKTIREGVSSIEVTKSCGTGTMATTTCTYGVACTLRANAFTRSGYTFSVWSGSNGGSYSNGQAVSNLTATNGATITMTANWSIVQKSGSISAPGVPRYFSDVSETKLNVSEYSKCKMTNVSGGSVVVFSENYGGGTQIAHLYNGASGITFSVSGYTNVYVYGGVNDGTGTSGTINYILYP